MAFSFWSATRARGDLDILRAVGESSELKDAVLRARLLRGDRTAIPSLLEKVSSESVGYWWQEGRHIWAPELTAALDRALTRRAVQSAAGEAKANQADWILSELIMRCPTATAEGLLSRHWETLAASSCFVQAALYVATPRVAELASTAIALSGDARSLLLHLTMHLGVRMSGHPGLTRKTQLEVLVPHLKHLDPLDLRSLWRLCNDRGWYEFRRAHLDARMDGSHELQYLNEGHALAALDEMANESKWVWTERWIDDFLATGIPWSEVAALLRRWVSARKSPQAWKVVAAAFAHAGERRDIASLWAIEDGTVATAAEMIPDAEFAIMQRTLR